VSNIERDLGGYQVLYGVDQGNATVLDQVAVVTAPSGDFSTGVTSLRLTGLAGNTTYRVAIRAFDETEVPDPQAPGGVRFSSRRSLPSAAETATTGAIVAPVVRVTMPNGGEFLPNNGPTTVTWEVGEGNDLVAQELQLSTDGGGSYRPLAQLEPGARRFVWDVPAGLRGGALRLRVVASDQAGNQGADASDGNFAVGLDRPPPPPPPPPPCVIQPLRDVTGLAVVTRGKVKSLVGGRRYRQQLTVRNVSGAALSGLFLLTVEGLGRKVRLLRQSGTSSAGQPYLRLAPAVLAAGQPLTLTLEFSSPKKTRPRFTTHLWQQAEDLLCPVL
jgi:hypothetical protein